MSKGKLTVLVGGQYGSEGKGAIAKHVAFEYQMHVRVGSPNAGHTIWWNGKKHVMQSIPCGWINPDADIVIGRGALLNMKQLMKEIVHILQYYPNFLDRLFIDAKAGVLDEKFHEQEGGVNGEMHRRIGSTGEGVGPARIARLERDPEKFRLFEEVADEYGLGKCVIVNSPMFIANHQDTGHNVLIEGTQGSALSLLHSHWPFCTSVDTNAAGIISEVGIAPSRVTDVLMVCRTYPIRVAGNSGPMKNEITWDELSKRTGMYIMPEKTTVTSTITREGITSVGVNRKIWPMYKREASEVRVVLMTMLISMEQSWLTDMERLFSSPGLYCRKKLAGRESRRIIMDASTPREVLACSLFWIKSCTLPISWAASAGFSCTNFTLAS